MLTALYDDNPAVNKEARLIQTVHKVDKKIMKSAGNSASCLGTGGMITKLGAAKYATDCGIDMIIASGEDCKILYNILDGEEIGTIFLSDSQA